MRSAYMQLFWKEVQQAMGTALVFTLLLIGWLGFLMTRVAVWPDGVPFGLAMASLGFVPFWAYWRTFYSLRQEWNGDHMYLLLSLPVPSWYITSTELLVATIELIVYSALILTVGFVLFLSFAGSGGLPTELLREAGVISTGVKLALLQGLGLLVTMIIIQFSYLFGRLAKRRTGLLSMLVAVVSGWFVVRFGGLIAVGLKWLPEISFQGFNLTPDTIMVETVSLGVAPVFGSFIAALLLYLLGSKLLERDIEL